MAVREVVRYPAAILKSRASQIEPGDHARALAEDLVETMRASPACVGLAAPQIGVGVRAFCIDVTGHRRARSCHGLVVMLNPVLTARPQSSVVREGCMSLPHYTGDVRRAERVVVEGISPEGAPLRVEADAFEARALQHEIDHLDGLLFLDRIESPAALFARKRW